MKYEKGCIPWTKGKHHSNETRRKISIALKGNKNCLGYKHTNETKEKMGLAQKGKKISEETRRKISLTNKGKTPWMKGKHHSKETIKKISKTYFKKDEPPWNKYTKGICKSNSGTFKKGQFVLDKHPNWKGGKSFKTYVLSWTKQLKRSIRERDNNVCQLCKKHQSQLGKKMSVHHIDYIKTNNFTFNLISVCVTCHGLTFINRNHWKQFFRDYLSEKYGYNYTTQQKTLVSEVKV